MPRAVRTKRGEEYLPGVPLSELEEMHRRERPGKSRDRLQAALLRKRGWKIVKIARIVGRDPGTVSRWLRRVESRGPEARHDRKSPGRPPKPDPDQERAIKGDLDKPPGRSGFGRGSWNSGMVAGRMLERFGIACSRRTALRVANRLGFSVRKPRPVPYNGATPEEQAEFVEEIREIIARWRKEGRAVLAVDAAIPRDSPVSRRGI